MKQKSKLTLQEKSLLLGAQILLLFLYARCVLSNSGVLEYFPSKIINIWCISTLIVFIIFSNIFVQTPPIQEFSRSRYNDFEDYREIKQNRFQSVVVMISQKTRKVSQLCIRKRQIQTNIGFRPRIFQIPETTVLVFKLPQVQESAQERRMVCVLKVSTKLVSHPKNVTFYSQYCYGCYIINFM